MSLFLVGFIALLSGLACGWKAAKSIRCFYCPICDQYGHLVKEADISSVTCHTGAKQLASEALAEAIRNGDAGVRNGVAIDRLGNQFTVTTR